MSITRTVATLALGAALLTGGCGRDDGGRSAGRQPVPVPETAPRSIPRPPPEPALELATSLRPAEGEVVMTSQEGGFSVIMPPGCARVRTRTSPPGASPGAYHSVRVFCDRQDRPNEGVAVSVFFKERGENGGPPNPRNVTQLIEEMAARFGVAIQEQRPVARTGWEGVRVFCREVRGTGVMWIQGMLVGDRVVVMSAWRPGPEGLSDAQIGRFFQSYQPLPGS